MHIIYCIEKKYIKALGGNSVPTICVKIFVKYFYDAVAYKCVIDNIWDICDSWISVGKWIEEN